MLDTESIVRSRVTMSDHDIVQHFKRLGFMTGIRELKFTTEQVEEFVSADSLLAPPWRD